MRVTLFLMSLTVVHQTCVITVLLTRFYAATEVEQKEFMRAFIERIDIFPKKQPDGNWIRNIVFAFPVPYNGKEIREFPLESQSTVECVLLMSKVQ